MRSLRRRDQLLSLKYSTIEACFSVPMLNLTMPSFPFVVAFAAKALGWRAGAVGLMAALPHICNFLQPLFLARLSRYFSSYELLMLTFTLSALPWGLAGALPGLEGTRDGMFAVMLLVGTLANSVASVSWSAAISELVPERLAGKYFARRNLVFGAWTLVAVMLAGHVAEWNNNSLVAFGWIFTVAGISRMLGLFFLTRMRFQPIVMERHARAIAWQDLLAAFRNANYRRLCVFIGLWGLLLNAAMPFYTMFLVDKMELGLGTVVMLTTLSSLG